MSTLAELPDIDFVQADVKAMQDSLIKLYESIAKRQLAPADPLRIFINAIAYKMVMQEVKLNQVAKGQLLRYARNAVLDHLGAFYETPRLDADFAVTMIQLTLSTPLTSVQVIPAGTRIGPTEGDGTIYFSTKEAVSVPIGEITITVAAECNVSGLEGNGYIAGQLTTLIDPLPYVASVTNLTETSGGAAIEDNDPYRERIHIAPESFSVAGPDGAYEYWAKTASASIADVHVDSPGPMQVVVTVLLAGGVIPSQTVLEEVFAVLDDRKRRPLTDKVTVQAPTEAGYDVDLTYYIRKSRATDVASIQRGVEAALSEYKLWQKSKLGRDINPSRLTHMLVEAGASRLDIRSPSFLELASNKVAKEGTTTAVFGGLVDD
ncbi:baseplate J/gp47 family protein [Paenibacillus kribbensis]|uniref:baseplate assembly protein n=1 Tax=Paenibacillus kribbensis TaxID=172713 RepID=UPI002DBC8E3B|nr:baseplate J/gp47 family protein [Paenibacillus kribbensis]MEC0237762.1 baseplate J/gp47 family protein [Paenibacillus kribbensis]